MLSLVPQLEPQSQSPVYAEAVSRLASVRHALRLVEGLGSGPEPDIEDDAIAAQWPNAGRSRQRCFDRRSGKLVSGAAAGLEALLAERHEGREPHAAASQALADEIRRELRDIAGVILA